MAPHIPRIPELPGELVPRPQVEQLRQHVAFQLGLRANKFPGSQPVSFAKMNLDTLEQTDFWVCEKSDGVRVLLYVHTMTPNGDQNVYLIDRHNEYRILSGLFFPHYQDPRRPLGTTLLDGELILDVDPKTGQETLRLLLFDCLIVDEKPVISRSLDKRYGRLKEFFLKPYKKMLADYPEMRRGSPFDIQVKEMLSAYHIEMVFDQIPHLHHGNDGLIYTNMRTSYVTGTDNNILKWKPPSENSIDFKLVLRFPPDSRRNREPDYCAKPIFGLNVYTGESGNAQYEPFDVLHVEDDEWENLKASGEQIDDRIVEVYWDTSQQHWRMMRFRDDKPHGNHKSVVGNIISSIIDGVEKKDLLARVEAVRIATKRRAASQSQMPPEAQGPPPQHSQPSHTGHERVVNPYAKLDMRYGPLQQSPFSKVGGPPTFLGFIR